MAGAGGTGMDSTHGSLLHGLATQLPTGSGEAQGSQLWPHPIPCCPGTLGENKGARAGSSLSIREEAPNKTKFHCGWIPYEEKLQD